MRPSRPSGTCQQKGNAGHQHRSAKYRGKENGLGLLRRYLDRPKMTTLSRVTYENPW
jgi:hypothetical protein